MRIWVAGAEGMIAQAHLDHEELETLPLDTGWIKALTRSNNRLFALADDTLWTLAVREQGIPEVLAHKRLKQVEPLDICVVSCPDRDVVAVAAGSGLCFLDVDTLEGAGGVWVPDGVCKVRPAGVDAVVFASRTGYISRHIVSTKETQPYFSGKALGGIRVNDLCADGYGGMYYGNGAGWLSWYDKPGLPAGCERVGDGNFGSVAMTRDWFLATRQNEFLAFPRRGESLVRSLARTQTTATAIGTADGLILVVDLAGNVYVFAAATLGQITIEASRIITTDLSDVYAMTL